MKYFLYVLVSMLAIASCKKDNKASEDQLPEENIQEQIEESLAPQAYEEPVVEDTLAKPKDDSWQSYLATETWEFTKGIAMGNAATEHVEGRWIRFQPDFTFETGKWENVITVGEWTVSDKGTLHLKPMDGTDRESEWTIRKKLNSMVWSGTPKFGNNTSQYFLVRSQSTPQQVF